MRTTAIVLVALPLLAGVSSAFQSPFLASSRVNPQQQHGKFTFRHQDTSLNMGLRTFLKQKLGRDNKKSSDDKNYGKSTKKKSTSTAASFDAKPKKGISIPKQSVSQQEATAPVAAKKQTQVNVPPPPQQQKQDSRLPRLRQESVKDRLNRVRSGKMTEDEKQAFLRTALTAGDTSTSRKPLRQALPDESRRPANSTGNATPYPKDSLLSNMARGWAEGGNATETDLPLRTWKDGAQLEDQKKKKAYFDMVTNPNRFHTYKSSMVTQPGETDLVDPTVHDGLVIPQTEEDDDTREQQAILEEEVIEEIKAYEQTAHAEGDLGTRLEKAAHALEEAAKQREIERKEKEARLEKQRQEQKARLLEIQRKQQLEMEKRELELKAKRREEEEAQAAEMEKKRKEEEARRKKLEAEQDAYWARKLQKEKESRMQGMTAKQRDEFVKHEVQAEEKALEIAEQEEEALEAMQPKADPVQARIDTAAADYLSKESDNAYEARIEQKRLEAERARDEQIARLKALNSPLPAPSSRGPPTATPVVPPASFASRGASELSNLKNQPAPSPTTAAKSLKTEPTIADMMNEDDDDDFEEIVAVESSSGSGFLSRVLGSSGGKKSAIPAPPSPPEPKRIVRQKLPLGDDEDDDFDTFDRNGPNRRMSIADAMSSAGESTSGGDQEQRSKMWGVDMSRIAKSLEDEKKAGN